MNKDCKTVTVSSMNPYGFSSLDDDVESNLFENEFKCKSLVRLEEKEYLDQIITTTTTVRTKTKDDLVLMFDSNFYESENASNLNLNMSNANNNNGSINTMGNMAPRNSNYNMNQGVYSSLANYFSK